jgi:hypothetical protein
MKRYFLYVLPMIFLFFFLFRVPVFVPAVVLPHTVIIPYDDNLDSRSVFSYLHKYRRVRLLVGGVMRSLRKQDFPTPDRLIEYLDEYRGEESVLLENYTDSIVKSTPALKKVRLVFSVPPDSRDIAAANRLQSEYGLPVEIDVISRSEDPLLLAYAYTFGSREIDLDFDLLFSTAIQGYEAIEVHRNDKLLSRIEPGVLAEGRHYITSLPAEGDTILEVEIRGRGTVLRRQLQILSRSDEDPQLLMVSHRGGNVSFLEGLYSVKKIPLSQTMHENLLEYPLLVFDGIPLQSIDPQLSGILRSIYEDRSTSLLFVSDSPSFGSRGDNPEIEEILPVELAPRSLKYLPDMGILIVLDISASMSGKKLSLAKVSTLELIKNLKDTDRISILTFWDQFRFLHDFEERKNLDSEVQLAPLVAQGGTDLFAALEEGLNRLVDLPMPQRHVIILTDGKTKEGDFDSLIDQAQLEDITISTLAVGEEINAGLLTRLALKSGGNFYRVNDLAEIPSLIFQDRREIARASFGEDLFPVSDFTDTVISQVTGMSLYTPKPQRILLYKNQYDDPLLIMEKRDRQLVMMLLSDLYGYYTEDFLSNIAVVRTLQRAFDSILQKNRISIRVAESHRNISLTVNGEQLVDPVLSLYADNRLLGEHALEPGSLLTYSTSVPLSRPGRYTAILLSRGAPFVRFPLYFNGNMEGETTDSRIALQAYKTLFFRALPAGRLYLIIFFLTSIVVTLLSRQSVRKPGGGGG